MVLLGQASKDKWRTNFHQQHMLYMLQGVGAVEDKKNMAEGSNMLLQW